MPKYLTELSQSDLEGAVLDFGSCLCCGQVASRKDRIEEHIQRHSLSLDTLTYMKIAAATQGQEGRHYVACGDTAYLVTVRGMTTVQGAIYSIVRSVVYLGHFSEGRVQRFKLKHLR